MVDSDMTTSFLGPMSSPKPSRNYFFTQLILSVDEENEAKFFAAAASPEVTLVVDVLFDADIIFFSLL